LAAETYGLKILKENIQDQKDNFTRFIILSNKKEIKIEEGVDYITSLICKKYPLCTIQSTWGICKK